MPDPLPGIRTDAASFVGTAARVAVGDLDHDGRREIVAVDPNEMRVFAADGKLVASAPVTGGIDRLVVADIDGDGKAEIYAGWGQSREHQATKARVSMHRLEGGKLVDETVIAPETARNEITALVPVPEDKSLLLAYFDSKYNVTSVIAKRSGSTWTTTPVASLRMATSYARGDVDGDGKADLVVGRVYGDAQGVDGDAFVLRPDGTRTKIPSTRGLRSIAVIDNDVFLGDGWHQNYAAEGRGLLTRAHYVKGAFTTELVEDTAGQFGIDKILPAKIAGKPAIVTLGNHYVRVFLRDGATWRGLTVGGPYRDVAVGDLDRDGSDDLVLAGDKSEIVKLKAADWPK
jgi:hypothetical protein